MGAILLAGGVAPGGGGRGAMPTLAAAAAAAEAYFNVSPGGLVGTDAGFILLAAEPLDIVVSGVCNVASAGKGLFSCVDALRTAATGGSWAADGFALPPGMLDDRPSASGVSSCID